MESNEPIFITDKPFIETIILDQPETNEVTQPIVIINDSNTTSEEASLKDILKLNREKMMTDVKELEKLATKVGDLIPTEYNYKTAGHYLLDRVRTMTEFHKTILNYRSEIERVTLDEIKLASEENKTTSNAKDILTTISELPVSEAKKLLGLS